MDVGSAPSPRAAPSPRDPRPGAKRKGAALADANGGKAQRASAADGPKREKVRPGAPRTPFSTAALCCAARRCGRASC